MVLTGLLLVYPPLPTIDGEYRLLGLEQRAEVLRDGHGVAHIYARTAHDLFYLQGYVTAQDRLFQMDLYRRAGAGRLSEVFGEPTLEADRSFRTIGLARVAAQELDLLREDTRAALSAYTDGVNKLLEQRGGSLPLEFVILGYRPDRWTALDSIVVAKLQAYDAAGNYVQELLRADLALRFGTDALATLMPDAPGGSAGVDESAWAAVAPHLSATAGLPGRDVARALLGSATGAGSNCWALAGTRTATGKPFLAGDTHLPVRNPSIWYEIGLEGAGYKLTGFSFAGIPGVVIGHNDRIAWSLTYAYSDTQDLFVERRDPADPRRFEYRGSFEPATVLRDVIGVRGREGEPIDVEVTRHGPIVTPLLKGQTAPLALRWTALEPGRLVDFVLGIARAGSWNDFRAAAADFAGAAVSACYADVDGHIGYQLVGRLPLRKGDGRMPVPGWTGEYDWSGYATAEANPSVFDPPSGVIANSNDRPVTDPDDASYAGEWDPGFRARYLRQRLEATERADLAAMRLLQTDLTSLSVGRLREALLGAKPSSGLVERAHRLVREWDAVLAPGSAAAAIHEAWVVHMLGRVFRARMGDLYERYVTDGRAVFALYELVARPDDPWFADGAESAGRGRDAVATLALEDAVADLSARMGSDPAKWRWGRVHTVTFAHPLAIGPLGALLNVGPIERGGDDDSVNDASFNLLRPYGLDGHASQRMIADLGDLDRSLSVTPIGQSGQPGSKYWADQTPLWAAGGYKVMRFSRGSLGRLDGALRFTPR